MGLPGLLCDQSAVGWGVGVGVGVGGRCLDGPLPAALQLGHLK